jgi:uncharacterized membrane protein
MEEQNINQTQTPPPSQEAPKEEPKEEPKAAQMPEPTADAKDINENKLWALLGYLGILCLIPLLAKKDSKFAHFHAKQGLILLIGEFFVWIPLFGWLLGILIFILWIMGIVSVFSGKMKPLPIVGELAAKMNI